MKCTAFRAFERATLQGFATLVHENGIILLDCAMHVRDGKRWVSPPSRPMLDKDRCLVIGDDKKIKYVPVVEFADTKTRSAWSSAAVAAIAEFRSKEPATGAGSMNGGASQAADQGRRNE